MTEVAIAQTALLDGAAGLALGKQILEKLSGTPDALIVFASSKNDYEELLRALSAGVGLHCDGMPNWNRTGRANKAAI